MPFALPFDRRWSLLGCLLLAACASCPRPVASPPTSAQKPALEAGDAAPGLPAGQGAATVPDGSDCPRASSLEPAVVRAELACLLGHYVRIRTVNPPGDEAKAVAFLAAVLRREGIEPRIIESAPGRENLLARIPGAAPGDALVLMHHMDVVPAVADAWQVPPFSGLEKDGALWGRGSIDNKGAGVVHLLTLLLRHRLQKPTPHDLVLLAVADEEAGGGLGARFLLEHHRALFEGVAGVLNEGGGIIDFGGGRRAYSVEVAQKAPLWLRVTARGHAGHGSSPTPAAATHVLARALGRLAAHEFPVVVLPEVQRVFAARAVGLPPAERKRHRDLERSLKDAAFRERFLADPQQAKLVRNTLAITVLSAGDKENVIPGEASAVLDLRLLPGQDAAVVTETLRGVMAEQGLEIETLLSWQGRSAPVDTPLFAAVRALAAQRDPDAPVAANVIAGFTDCNAFRAAGLLCYGFLPMRLSPASFPLIHGHDERVQLDDLTQAVVNLSALVDFLQ